MNEPVLLGEGVVRHARLRPVAHRFAYPTFFLLLPMRTLRSGAASALAFNRRGAISFHDRDHGDGRDASRGGALAWLEELLQREGIHDANGEIWLHTYPRVLGYVFKPVSFWYCHRAEPEEAGSGMPPGGTLRAIVVEVNNTFGERHCYLLEPPQGAWGVELHARKVFHVSPFCTVQGDYRFRFLRTPPGATDQGRTVVRIEHHDPQGPLLLTSVSGTLRPATADALRTVLWRHPLMTLTLIARIHWQALRLWLRRVPFFRKPAPPAQFVTRA